MGRCNLFGLAHVWGTLLRCNRKQLAKILGHDVKTIDKMVVDGMPYVSRPDKKQGANCVAVR